MSRGNLYIWETAGWEAYTLKKGEDKKTRQESPAGQRGTGLKIFDDGGICCILANALDSVERCAFCGVDFAGCDDFAVAGLKIEYETVVLGLLYNKFAHWCAHPFYQVALLCQKQGLTNNYLIVLQPNEHKL